MTYPFSPTDVIRGRSDAAHPDVIEVVNARLMRSASVSGGSVSATLHQEDVVAGLVSLGHARAVVFRDGMLDFEASFRSAGWEVVYHKSGYNESGDSYWRFTRKQ